MTLKKLAKQFRSLQEQVIAENWTGGPPKSLITRDGAYSTLCYDVARLIQKASDDGAFDSAKRLGDFVHYQDRCEWVGNFLQYLGDVTKLQLIGEAPDGKPLARIADALEQY